MFRITKRELIRNLIVLAIAYAILFSLDFLSKHFISSLVDSKGIKLNPPSDIRTINLNWIGFRNFHNKTTTIFSFFNSLTIPLVWHHVIGFTILALVSAPILLCERIFSAISLSILSAGIAGNVIDRAIYGYVRDIIFTPWFDRGTFNVADVVTISGSGLFAISAIVGIFRY